MTRQLYSASRDVLLASTVLFGWAGSSRASVIASDNAANLPWYAAESGGAWKGENPTADENPAGMDNGGIGFQAWNFAGGYQYPSDSPYGRLNHFIDGVDFAHSSYNNLGAPAFGLTNDNVPFGGATARATRTLNAALAVGDSVTLNFDNPVLAPLDPAVPDPAGFIIRLNTGQGAVTQPGVTERFGVFTTSSFNNGNWAVADLAGNIDLGLDSNLTTSAAQFRFTLVGPESYTMQLLPLGGGAPLASHSGNLSHTGSGSVDSLEIVMFENGSGNGLVGPAGKPTGQREFFFNDLLVESSGPTGDYNADGIIDGADFMVWQRTLGSTSDLAADGNRNGTIDAGDLAVWEMGFGAVSAAALRSVSTVPEPVNLAQGVACFVLVIRRRRFR